MAVNIEDPIQLEDEVQKLINEVIIKNNFQNTKIDVSEASAKGENYLGQLYRVKIEDTTQQKSQNFIVKVALKSKILRDSLPLGLLYQREINAYKKILPTLYHLQEKYNIPESQRFSHAKYFDSIEEEFKETLILEDLGEHGFKMYNRKISFDIKHLELAIKTLARFHATSFVLKQTDHELFEDLTKLVSRDMEFGDNAETFLKMARTKCINILKDPEVKKRAGDRIEDMYETMKWFVNPERTEPYNVICHGDCWINNFLFKYEGGCVNQMKFIDLQIIRIASPITDLAYMIFSSTDKEIRSNYYQHILDLYYETLDFNITNMGCETSKCYPFNVYQDQIKSTMAMGLTSAIMLLPSILNDKENIPDIEIPPEEFDDSMYDKLLSENCKIRINDVACDCMTYGYI